jgi:hypothetical protein
VSRKPAPRYEEMALLLRRFTVRYRADAFSDLGYGRESEAATLVSV